MKKLFIVSALVMVVAATVFVGAPASAHVLIKDTSATKGAVLHIIPDDDPIAGKEATLFFDTQGGIVSPDSTVKLTIAQTGGEAVGVLTTIDGSLVTSKYVFPTQGQYTLSYGITTEGEVTNFEYSLRVSRGEVGQQTSITSYAWAEALLIFCAVLVAFLAILIWNKRTAILKQSRMGS